MKTMVTWSAKPGGFQEAVRRFVTGKAAPVEGLTILGRWHSVDLSCGFTLYETNDMATLYAEAAVWADVLDLKNYIVIEDGQAGPILAGLNKR